MGKLSAPPTQRAGGVRPSRERASVMSDAINETQREMVRYCAGIDQWDAMPVVVEGWLRVFEQLQAERDDLLRAAKAIVAQFEAITRHQRYLLVNGQTFASAAANWDKATNVSIDFDPLVAAIAKAEGRTADQSGR
jgi:hypothetical protein